MVTHFFCTRVFSLFELEISFLFEVFSWTFSRLIGWVLGIGWFCWRRVWGLSSIVLKCVQSKAMITSSDQELSYMFIYSAVIDKIAIRSFTFWYEFLVVLFGDASARRKFWSISGVDCWIDWRLKGVCLSKMRMHQQWITWSPFSNDGTQRLMDCSF